ncbi:hypothetical protein PVL29_025747 [Vitis rotundifolia]|uniref:Uncharacterized protein n=1 Tax=Vitis rotundifolia TaxID=103349 RepID=A0AA38YKQ8_VITRO|nr:hypothetical protein PVL29_025747 [Vitis rotundifolia]
MAYSKTFLLVGLLFAVVLILSSEVSARELAETSQTQVSVEDAKYGGYGHGYGHEKGHGGEKGHDYGKGHGHGKPGHGKPGHPPVHGVAGQDVEEGTQN